LSVEIPKAAIVFGSVTPPQGDVIELRVHLGCTKEVSGFECLLQNWDKKYSPGGASPITVGLDGHIDIGRGSNVPQIITCRVESVKCESTPTENYIRVSGRCWGERVFRRVVTKVYENKKGEDVLRDLVDYYIGLDHCRENSALTSDAASGQKDCVVADGSIFSAGMLVKIKDDNAWEYNEVASVLGNTVTMVNNLANTYTVLANGKVWIDLIEKTDTTFTSLDYENTPVFDILKYIAESSDKSGVIGYDFRASAPDGKFEFFPKISKTSPVSLSEKIETSTFRKDIHRIRNKIMIYGLADKSVPADKDAWTESLTPTDGAWSAAAGDVTLDTAFKAKGSASIKVHSVSMYWVGAVFTLNAGKEVNSNLYPLLSFLLYLEKSYNGNVSVFLYDTANKYARKNITVAPGEWRKTDLRTGLANEMEWEDVEAGFDWANIKKVRIDGWFSGVGSGDFWIDQLFFGGRRYSATREDSGSQTAYGLRELTETDEEIVSDNECDLRARSLLDYFKNPAEYLTIRSTVIDYGNSPLLAGEKIHITLPNENVDSDFRIESVEYRVDAKTQTLEITLELGKVPPLLADYLYGLSSKSITLEKVSRTKLGKGAIPTALGGGLGSHHVGHEVGGEDGVQWASQDDGGWDKITGWIAPKHIGPFDDAAAIIKFRTKNKAGTSILDHQFQPSDNERGVLGVETAHWKELHSKFMVLYHGLTSPYGDLRIKVQDEANPKARLTEELLEFGPGGASAADVYLKRIAANKFELKTQYLEPATDNILEVGSTAKKVKLAYISSLLLPTDGYLHVMVYGEDNPKARLTQDALAFGPGGLTAPDTWLKRIAANDLEVSADILPDSDNARELGLGGATPKRWKNIYAVNITVSNMLFNFHLIPDAHNTYDIGDNATPKRWRNAYFEGELGLGGYIVITSARVLQNVTAAAGIITSGRFPLARLPEGASGYVLEAEGAGFDPMYVDPNGRYQPASHTHSHGSLTGIGTDDHHPQVHTHAAVDIVSGVLAEARCPNVYTGLITFNGGIVTNSVNCANWQLADLTFENKFKITEAEKLGLGKGLAFLNPKGKVLMMLDGEGNLHVAGKVKEGLLRKSKAGVAT